MTSITAIITINVRIGTISMVSSIRTSEMIHIIGHAARTEG